MADNNGNGNSIASLAKYGGFGVAIAALMLLGYVVNSNANGTKVDVNGIKIDIDKVVRVIESHDNNEQQNTRDYIAAIKELTKEISDWRVEMAKQRQSSERIPLN